MWIGAGLTGVGIVATTISGLDTTRFKKRTYDANPTVANYDAGLARERRTNALLVVTGVVGLATAAAAIWLVDWRSTHAGATADGRLVVDGTF